MQRTSPMGPTDWALLLSLSLLWGGSFFFVGVAVTALPPLFIVFVRVALAALVLWATVLILGLKVPRTGKVWGAFAMMGALNNAIPFALIVWGQTGIASGVAAILNATTPVFTVLFAAILAVEPLTRPRLFGVGAGILGVGVMLGSGALSGLGGDLAGEGAILGAAISYALATLYGRRFHRAGLAPLMVATGQVTASAALILPLTLWVDRPWGLALPGMGVIAALVALAVLSTAMAYILYFTILARSGPTNLALVTFLIPVSAICLGIVFLGESLMPRHILGLILIVLGLSAIDGRLFLRRQRNGVRR